MSDLAFGAKGEGSFPHNGQSLCALRVTSMKLLHAEANGFGPQLQMLHHRGQKCSACSSGLSYFCPFRPLSTQILKEERREIPELVDAGRV